MLYIEKDDKVLLPKQFRLAHNICVITNDLIGEVILEKYYKDLKSSTIKLEKGENKIIENLEKDGGNILEWLESNGRKTEINEYLPKHVFLSVVADFSSFIYESLSSAKKGKMSVAYSLLRKPLTDELLILEQLLTDKEEFIERFFHHGDPKTYDPSPKNMGKEKIKQIITESCKKMHSYFPFNSELIYDLRYNKQCDGGLNGIMNHAHHIVTTDPNYRTEKQNLNFVFSIKDDYQRYWEHYYYFVPYLLLYSSALIDRIAFTTLGHSYDLWAIKELRRFAGLIFWTNEVQPDRKRDSNKVLHAVGKVIGVKCNKCKTVNNFTKPDFKLFLETEYFLCKKCFSNLLNVKETVENINKIFIKDV